MCSQNCSGMYKKMLIYKMVFIFTVTFVFLVVNGVSELFAGEHGQVAAKEGPGVEHPIKKPKMYSKVKHCPNCGMMINMWARTRHSFHHPEGDMTTCSIRCMADKAVNSMAEPSGAQVALYLDPDTMVPVEQASYVVGSAAAGTMTMKSKIAFKDKEAADTFAATYGGEVKNFQDTYAAAKMELPKSRMLIDKKRKKTGKIKEPADSDTCRVCGMYPARYPKHNSQIWASNGETLHFCSTKCLVSYNANPEKYMPEPPRSKMTWVTLFSDGMYESAFGAYYVVGSNVDGPMGKEAIPFKFKKNAESFVSEHGGTIVNFPQLTPELVMGKE